MQLKQTRRRLIVQVEMRHKIFMAGIGRRSSLTKVNAAYLKKQSILQTFFEKLPDLLRKSHDHQKPEANGRVSIQDP